MAGLGLQVLAAIALGGCGDDPELRPEPGEALAGGDTTNVLLVGSNAFAFPASNLSTERRAPFFTGNAFFNQAWVAAPASTTARDGLGPTFHARSCSACHFRDGRGRPPEEGDVLVEGTVTLSVPGVGADGGPIPVPGYGGQLQPFGIDGVPGEARPVVRWIEVPGAYDDGTPYSLRRPELVLEDPAFGPFPDEVQTGIRMAPHMVGLGLLEAISATELLAWADPDDADGDGISGRIQRVFDVEIAAPGAVGRFGWKGGQPTVLHQSAAAFFGDMGLTNRLFEGSECPDGQVECREAPSGGAPEVEDDVLDKVAFYARMLAVPARRGVDDDLVLLGREVFRDLGCGGCHRERVTTGNLPGFPELSGQVIRPFTDLLLHDMGPDLADLGGLFEADGAEWRTPPLWGIGLFDEVGDGTFLLHDGRARGFAEAILWHGGEASMARNGFRALPRSDRETLLRFMESL